MMESGFGMSITRSLLLKYSMEKFLEKESDEQQEKNLQKERTIELEISELTSWLLGYKIPENISETVKAEICCINRIFLDEIV